MTDRLRAAAKAMLASVDQMLNNGEWYCATERAEALRAALAEPEVEPVAWMCPDDPERETAFNWKAGHCENCGKQRIPLYTAPPCREWVSLTDEEIARILGRGNVAERTDRGAWVVLPYGLARAIEAALKEKNT